MLSSSVSYRTNVAQREKVDDTEVSVKLFSSSIPELFKLWLEWRVELEKKCLAYRLKKQEKQIAYTELLIYAIGHIDTIAASLKTKDPHAYLMKALKISKEDANTILQLRVIQLSKLDGERLKERLAEEKERHGQLAKWLKKPSSKVAVDMEVILKGASKLVSPRVTSLYSRKESRV
jgi:DNA gyrase/topoisomerase IV subunit A